MNMQIFTKIGRFDFSGVATGGGHAVGVPIPPRKVKRVVVIDPVKVAELQAWGRELRAKFGEAGRVN